MKSKVLSLIFAWASILIFFSCEKGNHESLGNYHEQLYNVTPEQARKVALNFINIQSNRSKKASNLGRDFTLSFGKSIKAFKQVDHDGIPSYYILSFNEGGFAIIAADNRVEPILAYSNDANFPLANEESNYPDGLKFWFDQAAKMLIHIRNHPHSIQQDSTYIRKLWINLLEGANTTSYSKSPNESGTSHTTYSYVDYSIIGSPCSPPGSTSFATVEEHGPLLNTTWNQGTGYNDLLNNQSCTTTFNGRPPVGCVATAMGQIMRYHQKPLSYNLAIIPYNSGSYETSLLMKDLGNYTNMQYACDGSGTTMGNAWGAFVYDLGYSNAGLQDYSYSTDFNQVKMANQFYWVANRQPPHMHGYVTVRLSRIALNVCFYQKIERTPVLDLIMGGGRKMVGTDYI